MLALYFQSQFVSIVVVMEVKPHKAQFIFHKNSIASSNSEG